MDTPLGAVWHKVRSAFPQGPGGLHSPIPKLLGTQNKDIWPEGVTQTQNAQPCVARLVRKG